MPRYLINSQYPGSFVEGYGMLPPGAEVELPEKIIVKDAYGGRREVTIDPRCSWIPLDDAAKSWFIRYKRTPNPLQATKRKPQDDDDSDSPAGFESRGEKLRAATPKRASDS